MGQGEMVHCASIFTDDILAEEKISVHAGDVS